jgi:hypothetical protein
MNMQQSFVDFDARAAKASATAMSYDNCSRRTNALFQILPQPLAERTSHKSNTHSFTG